LIAISLPVLGNQPYLPEDEFFSSTIIEISSKSSKITRIKGDDSHPFISYQINREAGECWRRWRRDPLGEVDGKGAHRVHVSRKSDELCYLPKSDEDEMST